MDDRISAGHPTAGTILYQYDDPVRGIIAAYAENPNSIHAADIDGNGIVDAIHCSAVGNFGPPRGYISWWDYSDGNWTEIPVTTTFVGAFDVFGADIDGDGDNDIAACAFYDIMEDDRNGRFAWFENMDGGLVWKEHLVANQFWGAEDVEVADLDGDGDMDLLGAASLAYIGSQNADVAWFENSGGDGLSWIQHDVDTDYADALSVKAGDIDGDGDNDIVGASYYSILNNIVWWENLDGSGTTGPQIIVENDFPNMNCVSVADMDGDGDLDILGSSNSFSPTGFWENLDGSGHSWQDHPVGQINGRGWRRVHAADIDGDGDPDVQAVSEGVGNYYISWWENRGGDSSLWPERYLDFNAPGYDPFVFAADVTGNGIVEVLGSAGSYAPDQLFFWNVVSFLPSGELTSSILDGGPGVFWKNIFWEAVIPGSTALEVEIRGSNSPSNLGPWIVVETSGDPVSDFIDPESRYLQYRLNQNSESPGYSPLLEEIRFTRNPLYRSVEF
jgi:hypothetical protein